MAGRRTARRGSQEDSRGGGAVVDGEVFRDGGDGSQGRQVRGSTTAACGDQPPRGQGPETFGRQGHGEAEGGGLHLDGAPRDSDCDRVAAENALQGPEGTDAAG